MTGDLLTGTNVYVLDVGRVARPPDDPALGWAGQRGDEAATGDTASLDDLVTNVVADLRDGRQVALGFEAPGWAPVPHEEVDLLRARQLADLVPGRDVSAWCGRFATWGTVRLLAQAPWVLGHVAAAMSSSHGASIATLDAAAWDERLPLLVFEAFVAGAGKPSSRAGDHDEHVKDARAAVDAFLDALPDLDGPEVLTRPMAPQDGVPFSTLGATILHAGLSDDLACLRTAPLLVRLVGLPQDDTGTEGPTRR